jgi:hypothetical protein
MTSTELPDEPLDRPPQPDPDSGDADQINQPDQPEDEPEEQ